MADRRIDRLIRGQPPRPAGHADAGRAAAAAGARRDAPGAGIASGLGDERSLFQNRPPLCHSYILTESEPKAQTLQGWDEGVSSCRKSTTSWNGGCPSLRMDLGSLRIWGCRLGGRGPPVKHQPYERVGIARTKRSPGGANQAVRLIPGGQVARPLLQIVPWGTRERGGTNHRTLRETV